MKRTIVLSMALFALMFANTTFANDNDPKSSRISTLIINAKVTVMLVGNDQSTLDIIGDKQMEKAITFSRNGDTLVINSIKNKDMVDDGIVYISANQLRKILVNNNAHVRSLNTLQVPTLDVVINGICEFDIHNIGELNLVGTKDFIVEQRKETRRVPSSVLDAAKN